jgi:hypothetical protein
MRLFARLHQLPGRLAAGGYILSSGLAKRDADEETAEMVHGMAATAYPFVKDVDPATFTRLVSKAEIALGAALLIPFVPSALAGLALTGFAGGLLGLYLRLPGMREEGSLRPTAEGVGQDKDVWLLGIGGGLLAEELCRRGRSGSAP